MDKLIAAIYENPLQYTTFVNDAKSSYVYSSSDIIRVLASSLNVKHRTYILNELVLVSPSVFPEIYNMRLSKSDNLTLSLYSLNLDQTYIPTIKINDLGCLQLLANLQRLSLTYLEINKLNLSKMVNLEELYINNLYRITSLEDLPPHIKKLSLKGCRLITNCNFRELSKYSMLEELTLHSMNLTNLDDLNIPNLKSLIIRECSWITQVDNLDKMKLLETLSITHSYKIKNINLSNLPNLINFKSNSNSDLTDIQIKECPIYQASA